RRERNADWAERAVRESISADEREAAKLNVVDLVAIDIQGLILAVDGREVKTTVAKVKLETRGGELVRFGIGFRQKVLSLLGNPNIAYLLMLLGFYGLFFELANPGAIFPGIVGGISLILGFYALQVLPINYAGLLLILLGLLFFLLEIKVPSYGALTIGGVIAMTLGSIMLIDSPAPYLRISLTVIIPAVAGTAAFFVLLIGMGIRAQHRQPVTGHEGLVNARGVVRTVVQPERPGKVFIHGELWDAEGTEAIPSGESVRVVAVEGLRLRVQREEGSK
ncbi:MAG: nodulation protein NfeD, partial [Nitrospinota bacterium]